MFIVTTATPPSNGRTSAWADATSFAQSGRSMVSSANPNHSVGAVQLGARDDDHPIEQVIGLLSRLSGPAALLLSVGAGIALLL